MTGHSDNTNGKGRAGNARGFGAQDTAPRSLPLETVFGVVPDAVLLLDRGRDILRYNGIADRWFRGALESGRRNCADVVCGSGAPCAECPVALALERQAPELAEVEVRTDDGPRLAEVRAAPWRGGKGEVDGVLVHLRDLTETRALHASLEEHTRFEQSTGLIVAQFARLHARDTAGAITWTLAALGRLLSARRASLFLVDSSETAVDLVHEWCADGVASRRDERRGMALDAFPWALEETAGAALPGMNAGSTFVPLNGAATVIGYLGCERAESTGPLSADEVHLLMTLADTFASALQRDRQQRRLEESERRYRDLVELSPYAILYTDESLGVVECNAAASRLFGYDRARLRGMRLTELVSDVPEAFTREGGPAEGAPAPRVVECSGLRAGGDTFPAEVLLCRVEEGSGRCLVHVQDITDRKRAAAAMLQSSRMEATATLAGGIAHDFNNLMAAVLGNAELLQMRYADDEGARRPLADIAGAAQRAADLTHQMLAFARGGKYETRLTDLNAIARENAAALSGELPAGVEFRQHLGKGLWPVHGDPTQLSQVVGNLCRNAVEATEGGGTISVATRNLVLDEAFAAQRPGLRAGSHIELTISDSGCGIEAGNVSRVFEPFFTTKFQGRGLGLAAAYGIVKNHGGYITVESERDRGTKVTIYLPARPREHVRPADAEAPPRAELRGSETILVVEDEQPVLDLTCELLTRFGYTVATARNGREAVREAENPGRAFDLVLLDLGMPVMSGNEAFPRIRKARPELPVVITTGFEPGEATNFLLEDGPTHLLQKPYAMTDLLSTVRGVLERG